MEVDHSAVAVAEEAVVVEEVVVGEEVVVEEVEDHLREDVVALPLTTIAIIEDKKHVRMSMMKTSVGWTRQPKFA